jgi:glutamate carboxypeptidase
MQLTAADRAVLDDIERRSDDILQRTIDWCATNTGSRNLAGLAAQAEVLASVLEALPGALERLPIAAERVILADGSAHQGGGAEALHLTVRPSAPIQVLLTGHYDTVFPPESDFQTVVQAPGGVLRGPGVADMKGGLSVMVAALEALELHPAAARIGYTVLLSPDEEIGSPGSAPLLAAAAGRAQLGMTYEPCMSDGAFAGERKGSGNFTVVVRGRAAHAGREFARGRNAVAAAAELAAALDAFNGSDALTVNIARIDGGGALNVVPDLAVLRFNVRAAAPADADVAGEKIRRAVGELAKREVEVELHGGFHRPPKPMNAAQRRLFAHLAEVGALLGQAIGHRPTGGVCEGNNLLAAGLPNVDTLGVLGGGIHSPEEWASAASFAEKAGLSALLLCKLADGAIDASRLG